MMPGCPLRAVPHGYQHLSGAQQLGRHRHPEAYAAIVVSGGYLEAGDSGRKVVGAGGVVFHKPWEAHLNRIGSRGSRILNIRMTNLRAVAPFGELSDPDFRGLPGTRLTFDVIRASERMRLVVALRILSLRQ